MNTFQLGFNLIFDAQLSISEVTASAVAEDTASGIDIGAGETGFNYSLVYFEAIFVLVIVIQSMVTLVIIGDS